MPGTNAVYFVKGKIDQLTSEQECLEQKLSLKIAEITNELQKKELAEVELDAMQRRIHSLEEEFEISSAYLSETQKKLDAANKVAEQSESVRYRLNNQQSADEHRIEELETALFAASMATEEAERNYEETMKGIAQAEKVLSATEKQAEQLDKQSLELELQLKKITSELKNKEILDEKNLELEEFYSKRIDVLRDQLNEALLRAERAEAASIRYTSDIQRANETMVSESSTFNSLRKEMDSMLEGYNAI